MKRFEYANGGYLTIELTQDEVDFEHQYPMPKAEKKTPFEIEVSAIKEDIKQLDNIMGRLKDIKG